VSFERRGTGTGTDTTGKLRDLIKATSYATESTALFSFFRNDGGASEFVRRHPAAEPPRPISYSVVPLSVCPKARRRHRHRRRRQTTPKRRDTQPLLWCELNPNTPRARARARTQSVLLARLKKIHWLRFVLLRRTYLYRPIHPCPRATTRATRASVGLFCFAHSRAHVQRGPDAARTTTTTTTTTPPPPPPPEPQNPRNARTPP